MLIGIYKTLDELEAIMEEKITANRMALREAEKQYNELQTDIRYNPPKRGTEDERPAKNLELQKTITELQSQSDWIERKIEEAEKIEDKTQKVYLTLNDCLMLGYAIDEEETK